MFAEVALAIKLSWTNPSHTMAARRACSSTGQDVPRLAAAEVYRRHQSPTWLGMSAAMTALPEVWAATWPKVRQEADPRLVARLPLTPADAGRVSTATIADTLGGPWFFHVVVIDSSGQSSCVSNVVGR